jgi:predicted transcriptional regulator of viral defense system
MHDKKFIFDKNGAFGFYSGLTLQNAIGLTTPVPNTVEIVTNREKSRRREINVGNQNLCLRRSRTIITSRNVKPYNFLS